MAWSGSGRAEEERGAVAVFTAVLITTVLVGAASFAVDIGFQRMARRDMQAVADLVAMDMARKLDGRSTGSLVGTTWNAGVATSLNSQGETLGEDLAVLTCTEAEVHAADAGLAATGICAYPGILNADGTFSGSAGAAATHVKVLTRTSVDYFLPVYATSGVVGRSAIARSEATACFQLGSYAARLDAGDSALLGPLLGAIDSDLNLDLVSYQGLAAADVSLMALATSLGVGTLDELAATSVSLGDFYVALASALTADHVAQADLLGLLSTKVGVLTVNVGELLAISSGDGAGLESNLNVLDVMSAAAVVADGENGIRVEELGLNLPLVGTSLKGTLSVIEGKRGCGAVDQATATTSQVRLHAVSNLIDLPALTGLNSLLCLLTCPVDDAAVTVDLDLAQAMGVLRDAHCAPDGATVDVTSALVNARVSIDVKVHTLLGLQHIKVVTTVGSSPASGTYDYDVPPLDWGDAVQTGSSALLPNTSVDGSGSGLVGSLLSALLGAVDQQIAKKLIDPLVADLNTKLITQLSETLGLSIGGADLFMYSPPNCSSPRLAG